LSSLQAQTLCTGSPLNVSPYIRQLGYGVVGDPYAIVVHGINGVLDLHLLPTLRAITCTSPETMKYIPSPT
jgi:hypothetical protein